MYVYNMLVMDWISNFNNRVDADIKCNFCADLCDQEVCYFDFEV